MTPILSNEIFRDADYVCQKPDGTIYMCHINNRKTNPNASDTEKEQQPIWLICQITQVVNEDGTQHIYRKYPNGDKAYAYRVSDIDNYTYEYAK